jgi:hypothetical protein
MVMAADVDLRTTYQASTSSPAYPSEGVYKNVIMSCKVDVPALIAAGVLNSTDGLVYTSGTYKYKLFSLPKNTIVRGGWILVRTVEATGPTGTITIYLNTTVFSGTHALTGLGVIMSAGYGEASGITVPTAWNTGGGTDYVSIVLLTASIYTAIFDVCVDCIVGKQAYNAGSLAGSTGQ